MFLKCLLLFFSFATEKLIWRLRCNGFICWILIYSFFSPSGNCLLHFSSFVQTYSNNFYLPYNVTSKSYSLVLKFRRSVRRRVVSFHFHPISLPITISLIKLTKIARRSFWKLSFESINWLTTDDWRLTTVWPVQTEYHAVVKGLNRTNVSNNNIRPAFIV